MVRSTATLHHLTASAPAPFKPKPRFLSSNQSLYRKQISLSTLLQRYGFPPSRLHTFLSRNHFLLNSNLHDTEKSLVMLTSSFKIPHKSVVSLISDCPGVLDLDFLKRWEFGFSKFADLGVSSLLIKTVLEHSKKFQIGPDRFNETLKVLRGLGFSESTTRRVLEGFPGVIALKEWFGIENRLMPLLNEFKDLGFSEDLVRKEIIREPRILSMEVGELSRCLDLIRSLKCREPIKLKILSEGTFRAGFKVKLRVDCLCKHQLIHREALKILWKEPRVILYEIDDIEKKIDFVVKTMGFSVGCLVDVPEYLGVNFEKQIVPRYKVLEYLRAKGGLGDEVGLKAMINLSDVQVKKQHPTGLWKLLKPQQRDPNSVEDVKNMKSFMEGLS
ncbi:CGI-12 PROTEIN-RELATED [Salix koriyanagi]|uniref:CGI-12 PROTEIN-RELATED n=1 Tax=Salix koriyanagi TaxID=2511006 RepID=A0A9Q0W1L5_9ROSI|nr:CGI-12 PROTEIN-RELATED [Salix koriyanagi]